MCTRRVKEIAIQATRNGEVEEHFSCCKSAMSRQPKHSKRFVEIHVYLGDRETVCLLVYCALELCVSDMSNETAVCLQETDLILSGFRRIHLWSIQTFMVYIL